MFLPTLSRVWPVPRPKSGIQLLFFGGGGGGWYMVKKFVHKTFSVEKPNFQIFFTSAGLSRLSKVSVDTPIPTAERDRFKIVFIFSDKGYCKTFKQYPRINNKLWRNYSLNISKYQKME
jgi:hypothetical protein